MVRALGVSTVDSAVLLMKVGEGQNLGCSGRGLVCFKNYCTMGHLFIHVAQKSSPTCCTGRLWGYNKAFCVAGSMNGIAALVFLLLLTCPML